jgi:hypothetical protein
MSVVSVDGELPKSTFVWEILGPAHKFLNGSCQLHCIGQLE